MSAGDVTQLPSASEVAAMPLSELWLHSCMSALYSVWINIEIAFRCKY